MKTTGMVRRIDELGRIVIPKEIRKQLMMKEGESIAFSLENDKVVLTKFSMFHQLSPIIESLLESLYQKYHNTFLITNMDSVLMCSSDGLAKYQRKSLSKELILALQQSRSMIEESVEFIHEQEKITVFPLIQGNECLGSLIMITKRTPYHMMNESLLEFVKDIIEREIDACV